MKYTVCIVVLFACGASTSLGMRAKPSLYDLMLQLDHHNKDPFVTIQKFKKARKRAKQRDKIRKQTQKDLKPFFQRRERATKCIKELFQYCLIAHKRYKIAQKRYNISYQQYKKAYEQRKRAFEERTTAKQQFKSSLSCVTLQRYCMAKKQHWTIYTPYKTAKRQCEITERHYRTATRKYKAAYRLHIKEQQKINEEYYGISPDTNKARTFLKNLFGISFNG